MAAGPRRGINGSAAETRPGDNDAGRGGALAGIEVRRGETELEAEYTDTAATGACCSALRSRDNGGASTTAVSALSLSELAPDGGDGTLEAGARGPAQPNCA